MISSSTLITRPCRWHRNLPVVLFLTLFLAAALGDFANADEKLLQASPTKKVLVVLVGDSTVTDTVGWGKAFADRFCDDVEVRNFSAGGRSSKSFRAEGRMPPILKMKPDYALIQFGHNDQPGKGPKRETDPETSFRENLRVYVNDFREIGARPILVSSVVRRTFDANGRIESSLTPWAEATKAVAAEMNVPLVDLHAASMSYYNQIGQNASMLFNPKEGDISHFNQPGAEAIADLVITELISTELPLVAYLQTKQAKAQRLPGSDSLRPNADQLTAQRQQVFDYFDREIAAAQDQRDRLWQPDFSSAGAYASSVEVHRNSLRTMLGLVEDESKTKSVKIEEIGKNSTFKIERVTISMTGGLAARGLLFSPRRSDATRLPATIVCPDAETWPERLAETSSLLDGRSIVLVMQSVERLVDHPYCKKTRGKDRRWILYRLGFVVRRTTPGLDVQDTMAAIEFLTHRTNVDAENVSMVGYGQGGMTALLTSALDTRVSSVTVGDYFDCRNRCWSEPVDRRLRDQLLRFGDAELTALITPRRLTIRASSRFLKGSTAFDSEVKRASRFYQGLSASDQLSIVKNADEPSKNSSREFGISAEQASAVRDLHFTERLAWLRKQINQSEANRYARWRILERPASEFPAIKTEMLADYRQMTGSLSDDGTPPCVRSELALTTKKYRAYRVSIDVRKGVDVYGHLLVPLGFDGKRPAVICQHGFGGMPEKISGVGYSEQSAYHEYGRKLAEKGYVVFAPTLMHIQPSEDVSRQTRQATAIGKMRLAMPLAKTNRVIDFLETLPSVDKNRIGYYGLSYGGYSASWMTPLLDRLAVSIISGNFNDWRTKITSDQLNTSYLRHPDEDMYSWNCLNRFTYPELIAMMTPRPVCIEYGNRDGITTPEWTAYAWKQTVAFRDHLGLADRIHLYEFDGPHEIHGVETFDFLDRWLQPNTKGKM